MARRGALLDDRAADLVIRAVLLIALGVECPELLQVLGSLGERDRRNRIDVAVIGVRVRPAGLSDHDPSVDERGEDLGGTALQLGLFLGGLKRRVDERQHTLPCVAALLDLREHHGVRDAQTGLEGLGLALDQTGEGVFVPGDKALRRALFLELLHLLGVTHGLELGLMVLDLELRRLGDDHALGVKARAARAPGDLVELARAQTALLVAVEFRKTGEQDGVDGHVDAHAECVGAADHRKKALLGELLDEQAVAG